MGIDVSPTMVALARARLRSYSDRAEVRLSDGAVTIGEPAGRFDRFVSTYVLDLPSRDSTAQLAVRSASPSPTGRIAVPGQPHPRRLGVSEAGFRRLEPHPFFPASAGRRVPADRIAGFRLIARMASRVPRGGFLFWPQFRSAGGRAALRPYRRGRNLRRAWRPLTLANGSQFSPREVAAPAAAPGWSMASAPQSPPRLHK